MEKIVDITANVYKETIVRCLDCVHWKSDKFFCGQFHVGTPADGYCYMAKEQTKTTTGTDCSWK